MRVFVEPDYRSLVKFGEELCGDNVSIIKSPDCCMAVMADGLGSGVKASILSTLTTRIASTMLQRGATVEEVVDTMVATLPTCQVRKLAYSTFTILQVYSDGTAHLVEFDNPPLFLLRNGKIHDIPRQSKQIGGRKVHEARFRTEPGDFLCIVSDGVIHAGIGGILNLGWQWEHVAEYLEKIVSDEPAAARVVGLLSAVCENLYVGKPGDDATVVGLRIREPGNVTMFTGPPVDMEDDAVVVSKLMSGAGKRIVCGGTAAAIVSRGLGRRINTSLEFIDPDVPPMAYIEGIDLVTEGVLTISKAVELIKKTTANSDGKLSKLNGIDGASRLARLLLEDCTNLHLLVGTGVNPAHQNPSLPRNLSIKMQVVEALCKLLTEHGKEVVIEYF